MRTDGVLEIAGVILKQILLAPEILLDQFGIVFPMLSLWDVGIPFGG